MFATHVDGSHGGRVSTAVCMLVRTMAQKPMQLGSPNLTYKCSKMNPGDPFTLRQKVTGQGHESQKQCPCGSLHSCGRWLLLIININHFELSETFICHDYNGRQRYNK